MNGAWDVWSACTPACATHAVRRVPATVTARRCAAFAHAVRRALTDGERMADPVRLRTHARALLTALGIRLESPAGALRAAADTRTRETRRGTAPAAGTPAPGGPGTLIVVNHISWLDIPALLAVEPVTLLAKREVGGWPVVGGLARRAGTHFIDRGNPRELPHAIDELTELLASGRSVAVFPQATTWCTGAQGTFRRATFQAAIDAGAPVRPVTLGYTQHGLPSTVAAFCGEDTFASSLRRTLAARGLTIGVTAHPPLSAQDAGHDRRTLAALAGTAVMGGPPRPTRHAPERAPAPQAPLCGTSPHLRAPAQAPHHV
ncbi:lysophospholipid acyltransferase family protein [Streptomyces sp. NPDC017993]|uniref:lysophospholipid acyltransferase family protein n=1 Tax=Streptomyces sp. NPDC017993 TaxID=3365027 RepID=UPI0037A81C61